MATRKTASKASSTKASKSTVKDTVNEIIETIKDETNQAVAEIKDEAKEKKATQTKKTNATKKTVENIYIQQMGNEVSTADMVAKAKEMSGIKNPKTVDIYVRPEINTVYYVIDGETFGNFDLF